MDEYFQDISLENQSRAAGRFLTWRNLTYEEKRSIVRETLCVSIEFGGRGSGRVIVTPVPTTEPPLSAGVLSAS